ncbi:hypothetical protein CRD36_10620 [Paremcibacter congregatus]|uniref:Uncharacterized protein n=1 Tax=Paremcibacter congregatus TaxID=2043170 RepID=A0A2G4YR34_9PROT|nr:hypothetical protein CRD36_10620 [Paremcibacter congregatus]
MPFLDASMSDGLEQPDPHHYLEKFMAIFDLMRALVTLIYMALKRYNIILSLLVASMVVSKNSDEILCIGPPRSI